MEEFNEGMGKPLKYLGSPTIVFEEFPDEISCAVNISGCPCHCDNCSEPELRPWVGTLLTNEEIDRILGEYPDCTVFALMGGDSNYDDVCRIADYIHTNHKGIKVGIYSGRDWIDSKLLDHIDLYKIGRWIQPDMEHPETWKDKTWGPLVWPVSNQLLFEKKQINGRDTWINITYKFRRTPIGNWGRYVIMPEDNK